MSGSSRAHEVLAFLDRDGVVVRRGALVGKFGRRAVKEVLGAGTAVEVLPGILALAGRGSEFGTRLRAASQWLPKRAVISGSAALWLYQLCDTPPRRVTAVVPVHAHLRNPPWLRVVHSDTIARAAYVRGVRCASRERAVIDAWIEAAPRERVSLVLEAMRRSNLTGAAVLRELARMPRVRGRRELVAVLKEASDGIQSFLEHRAHRTVLNTPDFRGLQRQVTFEAMGKTYIVDTYDEATRTVIELDGAKVHGTREAKARDNARDAALATLGLLTVRIGFDDVMNRPLWCREVIRRAIASRSVRT